MKTLIWSIVKKEFIHIWRDPQTLVIVFLMPVLMLFLYGYAITLEMKEISIIINDHAASPLSRSYIDRITATKFFHITGRDIPEKKIEDVFQRRQARCAIIIPPEFSRQQGGNIQLLIDASDPNAANYILNYLSQITVSFNRDASGNSRTLFSVQPRLLYNPDLKSAYFFVPGLVAIIIILISALLTSIAIVREKELGSMEQILVSPIRPNQLIIGKLIPYLALSLVDSSIILLLAHFWFSVPIHGSALLLLVMLTLYILCGLSFGLLISTATRSQQVAMMATMVITILPSFLLSGFIFPVRSMPLILQGFSQLIPATHFLVIIRSIMLKGVGAGALFPQLVAMILFSVVLIGVSIRKFNTTLE